MSPVRAGEGCFFADRIEKTGRRGPSGDRAALCLFSSLGQLERRYLAAGGRNIQWGRRAIAVDMGKQGLYGLTDPRDFLCILRSP